MNHELIISSLQAALDAVGEAMQDNTQLALIFHNPEKAHPSVGNLLEALRAQPSLAIFDGKMQVLASQAMRMEISNLAAILLRWGLDVGSKQAVDYLQRYLDAKEIPFRLTLAITGLRVDHQCDLGSGIALIPWDKLPSSYHKDTIYTRVITSFGFKWPSAAMVQERILPKLHVSGNDYKLSPLDESEIQDAFLSIGVVGPFAPEVLVSWLEPPQWAPIMAVGYSMPHLEGRARHDEWTSDHCQAASRFFDSFKALNADRKDALRLPLQRLSMAMRRLSNVDCAVDLGIALEALFLGDLSDDRGELTFRLRLRVARYMERDEEKRETIFRLVGDLYKLRSIAVHTGRSPDDIRGRTTSNLLDEGYQLTAHAIRRFIEEGAPDWNKVQLG